MYIHHHHSHASMYAVVTLSFFPFIFAFETNGKCKLFEENNRRRKERDFFEEKVKKREKGNIGLYIMYVHIRCRYSISLFTRLFFVQNNLDFLLLFKFKLPFCERGKTNRTYKL